jgi:hypothetical protein
MNKPIILNESRFSEFPKRLRKLGFKVGAEIGVARGFYAKCLFIRIPKLKLYLIDPWKSYGDYVEHHDDKGQVILDACLEKAKERLKGYNVEFIRKTSMEAVKDFKDESLDFVFIDGNHSFEYVVEDIAQWSKKVRKGGIVSGHDYWNSIDRGQEIKLCQVKDAVDAWTKTNQIKEWFIGSEDKSPFWYYVKQ